MGFRTSGGRGGRIKWSTASLGHLEHAAAAFERPSRCMPRMSLGVDTKP